MAVLEYRAADDPVWTARSVAGIVFWCVPLLFGCAALAARFATSPAVVGLAVVGLPLSLISVAAGFLLIPKRRRWTLLKWFGIPMFLAHLVIICAAAWVEVA